jgi:hypothetical protein
MNKVVRLGTIFICTQSLKTEGPRGLVTAGSGGTGNYGDERGAKKNLPSVFYLLNLKP